MQSHQLNEVIALVNQGESERGLALCKDYINQWPESIPAIILCSKLLQKRGLFQAMLDVVNTGLERLPESLELQLRRIECLLYNNDVRQAIRLLVHIESETSDAVVLAQIAESYLHCSDHESAARCYARAAQQSPANTEILFNLASANVSLGEFDRAEQILTNVITHKPDDYDAYYNRATLRKQSVDDNHISEMQRLLDDLSINDKGRVALHYALGKEYEDLGDYRAAFEHWQQGATARKQQMAYRVETDLAAIEEIKQSFQNPSSGPLMTQNYDYKYDTTTPIFIVGLPRSGTTLVDRILSSHSDVNSLGEINSLAFSVIKATGDHENKIDLIRRSAQCDRKELKNYYIHGIESFDRASQYLIDKTPLNFLYLGLIAESIPNAKVIHLHRHPLESIIAMYKTLFRMGYPFSYDLTDLTRYIVAYRDLMTHWRAQYPDFIYDLSYEELVSNPEAESKQLIDFCGLQWQQDCLNFHKNSTPSATASAAQVRQPIYTSSVNKRQYFEGQLQAVRQFFRAHGVDLAQ